MAYIRKAVSAIAAIFAALFGQRLIAGLREISTQRQTGLGAVAGGISEALFSPTFWLLAAVLFVLFVSATDSATSP